MTNATGTPLRVLFMGVKWPPETFLSRLVRGLAERGHEITVAVNKKPDARWRPTPNVELLYVPGWSGSRSQRIGRTGIWMGKSFLRSPADAVRVVTEAKQMTTATTTAEQLYRWLPYAGRKWDVIYFPWNATAISYMPMMTWAPSVISCRGTQINVAPHNPERVGLRQGLPLTFDKAAAVHCVSDAICREATLYGLDRNKAVVIRPAVDPDVFKPAALRMMPDDVLRIAITGSVIWRKGYEYALSAVNLLRQRDVPVHMDIIGTGDETQRLLYTLNDLELTDVVTWHKLLPPAEVLNCLQQADVFLLASLSEGISNAVLEAMACGLPVVAAEIPGMDEAITDGVEGLLVPSRDPAAMADALAWCWSNPEACRQMGVAGRARIERDFRLDNQIVAFERLLRSVV